MADYNINLTIQNIWQVFRVIVDIGIMWFVFYYAIKAFRNNARTVQIFKGIVAIIAINGVAKLLGLVTVTYFTDLFLNWGLLAIIIIFQPELRRLLENLGRNRLNSVFWEIDNEEAKKIVDEFVEVASTMSKNKTGALMIIERETTLNDIVETGTLVDAKISAELIGNIFYEGSPLHDGALIVRGDRLHAAGCVLPLTENKKLSKELGTRHRAGIGITENSDAFVVIVSEETGIISVAENGKLKRPVQPEELRTILMSLYFREDNKKKITKRFSRKKSGGEKDA